MLEKLSIQLKHPICKCLVPDDGPDYGCNVGATGNKPHLQIFCTHCGSYIVICGDELRAYIGIKHVPESQLVPSDEQEPVSKKVSRVKIPENWKVIK